MFVIGTLEFIASISVALITGVLSLLASRNARGARKEAELATLRSKEVARLRSEIDAAQIALSNAQVDVIAELCWALTREGVGNGELKEAVSSLRTAQQHAREVIAKASKSL